MNNKIIRLIALALVAISVFSLCACNSGTAEEETTTAVPYSEGAVIPDSKAEVVEKFNKLMADTKAATDFEEMKYWLDHDAGGIDCENNTVKSAFKLMSDNVTNEGHELFSMSTKDENKKVTAKDCFPVMGSDKAGMLDLADVRSAVITDNRMDEHYTLIIKINPETNPEQEDSIYGKLYKISKDEDVLAEFAKYKDFFTVGEYNATYGEGTIKMFVNKKTDRVTKLELSRNVVVETTISGQGTLKEEIGADVPVKFDYNSTANYEIIWPVEEAAE